MTIDERLDTVVRAAGEDVSLADAQSVITGYCLGEERVGWTMRRSGVGDPVRPVDRGAFAYRTYDCIRPGSTSTIEPIDVLVADGLNAQMRAKEIAGVLAVSKELSSVLVQIDSDLSFWELGRDEVSTPPASEDERAWPLWRAWTILMGVESIDLARTHKILHHKCPRVFPLIDNKTRPLLDADSAWGAIHDDLTATAQAWSTLERDVGALLTEHHGVPLTRLRLHDILLWARAAERWKPAHDYGIEILDVAGSSGRMDADGNERT